MNLGDRLSTKVLARVGALLVLAIVGITALAYRSSFDNVLRATLSGLQDTVASQARHDSDTFYAAQQDTEQLRREWLRRLDAMGDTDPQAAFDRWFAKGSDGVLRQRPELDEPARHPSLSVRTGVNLDAGMRRQVLSAFELLREWGPPLTQRQHAVSIELPGVALITFSPSVNRGALADASPLQRDDSSVRDASPERNPGRGNHWTAPYLDERFGLWMVSIRTPVDHQGRWIGTTSQDLPIDTLLARVRLPGPDGSYQMLFNEHGELIAHPALMERIQAARGLLRIDGAADPALQAIAQALGPPDAAPPGEPTRITHTADGRLYLAAATIQGPQWQQVAAYPRRAVEQAAQGIARQVLAAGAATLVAALLLLAWLVRRMISQPLRRLNLAVDTLQAGSVPPTHAARGGELGALSDAFDRLAQAIAERDRRLLRKAEQLQREGLERVERERLIREMSHTMQLSADAAELGLWTWQPQADVLHFDAQMSRLHKLSPHPCQIDLSVWMRLVGDPQLTGSAHPLAQLRDAAASGHRGTLKLQLHVPAGPAALADEGPRWLSLLARLQPATPGEPARWSGVALDITQRVLDEERIQRIDTHDALTGLPNRAQMQQALSALVTQGTPAAVLFIDLDRFKHVNDSLGHGAGDQLLIRMAQLMAGCVRPGDLLSRLGGDEFVVLLPKTDDEPTATRVAQRMLDATARPVEINGHPLHCTPSIGIALHPRDGQDPATLVRAADIAMYEAKRLGRNRLAHFRPMMTRDVEALLGLEVELRRAIEHGEFELWLQPKMRLHGDQRTAGAEALLRWRRPGQGIVPPSEFLPAAQQRGLMGELNQHVLETACTMLARWHAEGRQPLPLAVNLSADHFTGIHLVSELAARLARHGVPASWLRFEITESTLLQEDPGVIERIHALRSMGVQIALDDFGTGYSSLSYLDRIPVDELKIDRSFIQGIRGDAGATPLVRAIVGLGKGMGLTVVAEGVESALQAEVLRDLGCDQGQGFHFARPMPAADFERWMDQRPALH
ncbi:bifunctional diguanylate cyclase/phosphodiesterase [Aquabacterium sp.]|uniref:bifunctional diguanylate cyclase/phosphodiesterase n=1 Tax=Aquabacterium sp. TaxID=1872578 RepID=UPI002B9C9FF0|nr:EAL domain-containing protein [Aquabacterium sp.]HSW06582.1 EAL domain-containing protein [Aquabacterium sp.]